MLADGFFSEVTAGPPPPALAHENLMRNSSYALTSPRLIEPIFAAELPDIPGIGAEPFAPPIP